MSDDEFESEFDSDSDYGSDIEPNFRYVANDLNILRCDHSHILRKIIKKNYKSKTATFMVDAYNEYKKLYIDIESHISEFYNKDILEHLKIEPSAGNLIKMDKKYFMDNKFILVENFYNSALEEELRCFKSFDGKLTFYIRNIFRLYNDKRTNNITLCYLHI